MKLTNQHRQEVIKACLKATFSQRDAAYDAMRIELGDALYAQKFGEHEKAANKLPQGWLPTSGYMEIQRAGFHYSRDTTLCPSKMSMSKHRRTPHYANLAVNVDESNPLVGQAEAVLAEFESLKAAKAELESKIIGIVYSVTTLEKLKSLWPEGVPFFPVEQPKQRAVVPYELAAEVNKIMGIKPETTGA